jgi:hypothetical protein
MGSTRGRTWFAADFAVRFSLSIRALYAAKGAGRNRVMVVLPDGSLKCVTPD